MKKILILTLTFLLLFSAVSCKKGDDTPEATTTATTTATIAASTLETTAASTSNTYFDLHVDYNLNASGTYKITGNEADIILAKFEEIFDKLEWKERCWKMHAEYTFYTNENSEIDGIQYSTSYLVINDVENLRHADISDELKKELDSLIVEITGKPVEKLYENASLTNDGMTFKPWTSK